MRWMLLKQLSKYHYQKAASEIIHETGSPDAATAEAIFERGNKTLEANVIQYGMRPRQIPRIAGRRATAKSTLSKRRKQFSGADGGSTPAFNAYANKAERNAAKCERRRRRAA